MTQDPHVTQALTRQQAAQRGETSKSFEGDTNISHALGTAAQLKNTGLAISAILQRLFLVFQLGLKYVGPDGQARDWDHAPVAAALSHGGRVNIRIPKVQDQTRANEFFDWLTGGQQNRIAAKLHRRSAATHGIATPEQGQLRERKGTKAGVAGFIKQTFKRDYWRHFGMDVPVGGIGEKDIKGNVILPDGRHGHLYIYYKPPTIQKDGSLLIGCEGSRAGQKEAASNIKHDYHAISSPISPTGGMKWSATEKTWKQLDKALSGGQGTGQTEAGEQFQMKAPAETGGMYVDLNQMKTDLERGRQADNAQQGEANAWIDRLADMKRALDAFSAQGHQQMGAYWERLLGPAGGIDQVLAQWYFREGQGE